VEPFVLPILRVVLALQQALPGGGPGVAPAGVHGTVRAATGGVPVTGVRVAVGHYAVTPLASGYHDVRFTAIGYQTRDVGVDLADSVDLPLDVTLTAAPPVLQDIEVAVHPDLPRAAALEAPGTGSDAGYHLGRGWQFGAVARGDDAFGQLLTLPDVMGRAGSATSLSVRGGGAMENDVLLDDVPLFDVTHFASASTAIDPDVIATLDLHTGVSSARFGDRLSGVIEMQTADSAVGGVGSTGAIDLADVRSLVRGPIGRPSGGGGFVIGARSSYRNLLSDGDGLAAANGYRDLAGSARWPLLGGSMRVLTFASGNSLGLEPASVTTSQTDGDGRAPLAAPSLHWSSSAVGAAWTSLRSGPRLSVRGWWSGARADIGWPGADTTESLQQRVSALGLQGDLTAGTWQAGVSLERPATAYRVTTSTSQQAMTTLDLRAAPVLAAAYLNGVGQFGRWSVRAGLRAGGQLGPGGTATVDPRLALSFAVSPATDFDIAAGTTHQSLQPMLNDDNLLGSVVGIDLPVAAGNGIPTARAAEVSAGMRHRLSPEVLLTVDGYARRWDDLLLPAASTTGLFVTDSLTFGGGRALGLAARAVVARGPLTWQTGLSLGQTIRAAGTVTYPSVFDRPWSITSDVSYRLGHGTLAQLALTAGAGNPASVVTSAVDWRPYQVFSSYGDLGGTPVAAAGAIHPMRLPGLTRVDFGLRRRWWLGFGGHGGALLTTIRIANLLNARNPVGFAQLSDGSLRLLRGTPRGLTLELGWTF
jgi:TonB-dependent Receptor Plug Domain